MIEELPFYFPKAEKYAFLYENAHLVMLSWKRDNAKFLFLIQSESEEGLELEFPGARFSNQVMDSIENIFFIQIDNEDTDAPKQYVLGSYFLVGDIRYGAYYERHKVTQPEVVLFRIEGESPNLELEVLDEPEFATAAAAFEAHHENLMQISRHRISDSSI